LFLLQREVVDDHVLRAHRRRNEELQKRHNAADDRQREEYRADRLQDGNVEREITMTLRGIRHELDLHVSEEIEPFVHELEQEIRDGDDQKEDRAPYADCDFPPERVAPLDERKDFRFRGIRM
jgi:hypothetical protein